MKKKKFDAVGWKSYYNTKKNVVFWSWACWRWACMQGARCVRAERAGSAGGRWTSVHAEGARGWACWALGRAGRAGKRSAGGRAAGRAAGAGALGARQQACGHGMDARGARLAQAGARRAAGWACLCAQHGRAGWVSLAKLVHCAPGSVLTQFLDPVRLGIFPESLNEHCSL